MTPLPTRALSLTGPWWWFMLHFPPEWLKRVENRSPGFSWRSFRGPCWVHAAKGLPLETYDFAMKFARNVVGVPEEVLERVPSFGELPRGGIVGHFFITDYIHAYTPGVLAFELQRWRMQAQSAFIVEDATPVKFVGCSGAQGFWKVPSEVLAELSKDQPSGTP